MRGHAQARGLRATTCTWAGTHPSAPLSATSTCHSTLGPSGGNPGVSCEQGAVALILGVTQRLQNCANSTVCLKTLLGLLSKVADNLRPKVAEPSPAASPRACGDCWPPGTVGTHFSRNRAGRCGESSLSLVETAGDQGLKAERRWRGYTQPRPLLEELATVRSQPDGLSFSEDAGCWEGASSVFLMETGGSEETCE